MGMDHIPTRTSMGRSVGTLSNILVSFRVTGQCTHRPSGKCILRVPDGRPPFPNPKKRVGDELAVTRPEPRIDIEIQLLRSVQLALAGAEIVIQRSEEIRHQSSGLMSIGG